MKVRACLLEHNMVMWQLADILKVGKSTLSVYMRYEWPEELQNLICDIIEGEPFDELKVWKMLRAYYIEKYADHIIRQVECLEHEKEDERSGRK